MHKIVSKKDISAIISSLWIFVLLNFLFRDIHELFRPGLLQEMMTGTVNGIKMTEELLLVAGFMLEIPIAMVVLSRLLNYKVSSWANIAVSLFIIILIIANGVTDLDDIFFAGMEVVGLIAIIVYARKLKKPQFDQNHLQY